MDALKKAGRLVYAIYVPPQVDETRGIEGEKELKPKKYAFPVDTRTLNESSIDVFTKKLEEVAEDQWYDDLLRLKIAEKSS